MTGNSRPKRFRAPVIYHLLLALLCAGLSLLGAADALAREEHPILLVSLGNDAHSDANREVVICVIDDFAGSDSHGERVYRMAEESSFFRCTMRKLDINTGNVPIANGYLFALRNVLTYAEDHRERIVLVNISLGSYSRQADEEETIRKLHAAGVVIVAAAGNDDTDEPFFPAAFDETLAVAATSNHFKADYSNFGNHIDIAAEGIEAITMSHRDRPSGSAPTEKIYYRVLGGTSFAAPRVTGLLGYLLKQRPELDPAQAFELLKKHAVPVMGTGLKGPPAGVGELDVFATLFHEDPLYRMLLATQIGVFLAMLLLFYLSDRERALFFMGLIFLGPLALGLNLVLIMSLDWIRGSQVGIVGLLALYLSSWIYFAIKRGRERKETEFDLGGRDHPGPRPWGAGSP